MTCTRPAAAEGEVELSVVVPLYNDDSNVEPLCETIHAALSTTGRAYEVLRVATI